MVARFADIYSHYQDFGFWFQAPTIHTTLYIAIRNNFSKDWNSELHYLNMAGVTSLLEKMTIANDTSDDVAAVPPLLSLPPELFQEIVKLSSQAGRISLSQTCRMLRNNHEMERALLAEPLSRSYLPMAYENSPDSESFDSKESVWGYTEYLPEKFEHRDTSPGPCTKQTQKYLTARQYYHYCSLLNEANGSCVRKLAISNFITLENVLQFAKLCPNIRHLDLESFMPPIDSTLPGNPCDGKKVSWEALTTKCPEIFSNVRSIRLGYSGSDSAFGPEGLKSLAMLLRQAHQLECLQICFTGPFFTVETDAGWTWTPEISFVVPRLASMLIECLAANASQRLTEIRFDNMLVAVRNLSIFINKLGESLPNLTKIGTTIDKDLQALSWEIPNRRPRLPNTNTFETLLFLQTPTTCWQYLRMLAQLAQNPRWTVTSLDSGDIHALSPHILFPESDGASGPSEENVELFRLLKEMCNWLPTFDWNEQMNGECSSATPSRKPLYKRTKIDREEQILRIRELFGNIREAGIPVQLLLSTQPSDPRAKEEDFTVVDFGVCFTESWETVPEIICNDNIYDYYTGGLRYNSTVATGSPSRRTFGRKVSHRVLQRSRIPWYLEDIEDLVDQFMIFPPAQDPSTPQPDVILLDHAFVLWRSGSAESKNTKKNTKQSVPTKEIAEQSAPTKKNSKQSAPKNKRKVARYKALQIADN